MDRAQVNRLIAEMGEEIDLPDLALDDDGYVCIVNENGVVVNIDHFEAQDLLVMYTTIGEIVEERRFEVYDEMLKANFLWRDTMGMTLAVSPDGAHALLMANFTVADLDITQLLNMYATVCEMTWSWAMRFRAISGEDVPDDAGLDAGDGPEDGPDDPPAPFPNQFA